MAAWSALTSCVALPCRFQFPRGGNEPVTVVVRTGDKSPHCGGDPAATAQTYVSHLPWGPSTVTRKMGGGRGMKTRGVFSCRVSRILPVGKGEQQLLGKAEERKQKECTAHEELGVEGAPHPW